MYDREIAPLDELLEDYYQGYEILGETETQHQSECALAGDSWPGALVEIENMREGLAKLRVLIARRFPGEEPAPLGASRNYCYGAFARPADPYDDIPF